MIGHEGLDTKGGHVNDWTFVSPAQLRLNLTKTRSYSLGTANWASSVTNACAQSRLQKYGQSCATVGGVGLELAA